MAKLATFIAFVVVNAIIYIGPFVLLYGGYRLLSNRYTITKKEGF